MRLLLALLLAAQAWAAVDGRVTNRSTGQPQAGVSVTLIKLGQGMETVSTATTDAEGRFSMAYSPQGQYLIQSNYQGVNYNHMLAAGTSPSGLDLEVYNSSKTPGDAKVAQHMVLLQPGDTEVQIDESIIYQNTGNTTYEDAQNGTVKFYVSPMLTGDIKVSVVAPQGMPITRPAEKTSKPNVYTVKFPVKPGETQFNISYTIPVMTPVTFAGKIFHEEGKTRLVVPAGVTAAGPELVFLSKEPRTQASIYDVKGTAFTADLTGTGTLRAPEGEDAAANGPQIHAIPPKVYDNLYLLVGMGLAILSVTFALLFRAEPAEPVEGKRRG